MATPRFINQRPSAASDPLRNFRFVVTFSPYDDNLQKDVLFDWHVGFTSISGLAMQTDAIQYREGGFHATMHQLPGQQQFAPVRFVRGVTLGSGQHWRWWKKIFTPGFGDTSDNDNYTTAFRCQITISVLPHPQPLTEDYDQNLDEHVAAKVRLMNAWPTALSFSDLNAGDSAVWVESMDVVHEGMDVEFSGGSQGKPYESVKWGKLLDPEKVN